MNLATVTQALYGAFMDAWSSTPVAAENEIFETEPSWVRLTVRELASEQQTLGPKRARRFRRDCAVYVQVFTPAEGAFLDVKGGVRAGLELAEDVRRFFEGESISAAKFHAATVTRERLDAETGRWLTLLVTCPFYFHETA